MRTIIAHTIFAAASITITAGAVAASAPAAATTIDATRHVTVRTADLDLQSVAGQAAAKHRIQAAASRACDDNSGDFFANAPCRVRAVDSAEQALARLSAPARIAAR